MAMGMTTASSNSSGISNTNAKGSAVAAA